MQTTLLWIVLLAHVALSLPTRPAGKRRLTVDVSNEALGIHARVSSPLLGGDIGDAEAPSSDEAIGEVGQHGSGIERMAWAVSRHLSKINEAGQPREGNVSAGSADDSPIAPRKLSIDDLDAAPVKQKVADYAPIQSSAPSQEGEAQYQALELGGAR